MAKIIWLGEPEEDGEGPRKTVWNGTTFQRGEEVEIDNTHMVAKAKRNPFFSVDGAAYVPGESGPLVPGKTDLSEFNVAELRALAAERGVDVEGLSKVEIREKLAADLS